MWFCEQSLAWSCQTGLPPTRFYAGLAGQSPARDCQQNRRRNGPPGRRNQVGGPPVRRKTQEIANKTTHETARQAGVTKLAAPGLEENARDCSQNHTRNGPPARRKTASAATPPGTTTQEIAYKTTYETARQAGVKPRRRQPRRARPRKRLPTKPHTKRHAVNKRTVHPVNKRTLHPVNKRTRCT